MRIALRDFNGRVGLSDLKMGASRRNAVDSLSTEKTLERKW